MKRPFLVSRECKKYIEELERRDDMLTALEAGGVDNWEWYGESLKEFFKDEDESEAE